MTQAQRKPGKGAAAGIRPAPRKLAARLAALFPERQIYIRSEGRVHFYTLSRELQATIACLTAIFLVWAAFSSVTVIFKDRIIAAEDHRFQRAQAAFEERSSELQMSYDDLMGHAADAQTYADRKLMALSQRQAVLARQADFHQAMRLPSRPAVTGGTGNRVAQAAPSFIRALHWLGFGHETLPPRLHHPGLEHLLADAKAIGQLSQDSDVVMTAIETDSSQRMAGEKTLIAQTGIDADQFLRKLDSVEGVGGPEVSLDTMQLDGVSDHAFSDAYFKAEANAAAVEGLRHALLKLPTAKPLASANERTSGFGPRLDPFTGHYAFHPGVDFAGAIGTAVLATADGVVTFAGRDGGYGNMVEVDHGFGFKTRYAHLLSVAVSKGAPPQWEASLDDWARPGAARARTFITRSGTTIRCATRTVFFA